jgi:hypothetical protein
MNNQFWAGLGSRAITEKKLGPIDYEHFSKAVFSCFHGRIKNSNFLKILQRLH